MKYVYASIAAFLVLAICYMGYGFIQMRAEAFKVYDVDPKFTYGAENADISVIYFTNYECDACREFHSVLLKSIKKDGKVRYIPRLVTKGYIWSETLAAATYAAGEQGKFFEMHHAIYKGWPVKDKKKLFAYARALELDVEQFSRDITKPEIIDRVREDQTYFDMWQLPMIPSMIIGEAGIFYPMRDNNLPSVVDVLDKFDKAR
ncbi:MAG: DsbA family protein [Alphaproteobacteria bacterium]